MSKERLSMRKIKEILRLRYEKRLSHRAIGLACGIGCTTVREYVIRAQAAGLSWPLPSDLDEDGLEALLFPVVTTAEMRPLPEWSVVHRELRRKGVTLSLLWQEYKEHHPNGYNYSRFCELYRAWSGTLEVTYRQEYKAGEHLFVDYVGPTMTVTNPQTGEAITAYLFVATQGASNYTYVEASFSMDIRQWIAAHVRAFEFFGGVNQIVTPDNTKTAVTSPCRYEPDLNPTYQDLAMSYGFAVVPARVMHPQDKAKVEAGVQGVERWVMAPLRHQKFFSLTELNRALRQQLDAYNERPFQKFEGSRRSWFEQLDKPALAALPATRYEFAEWKRLTVHIDYHVEVEGHRYSVPYQLVQQKVGRAHHIFRRRDLLQKPPRRKPRPQPSQGALHHRQGTHAQGASGVCGLDARTTRALGRKGRSPHGPMGGTRIVLSSPSPTGIPSLSGRHATGQAPRIR